MMSRLAVVYMILNRDNGKVYLGSTSRPEERWGEHRSTLNRGKHFNSYLQRAWKINGEAAFIFMLLEYCEPAVMLVRERWKIELCGSMTEGKGYNLGMTTGGLISEETRRKMSAAHKGKAGYWTGKTFTGEHRANL